MGQTKEDFLQDELSRLNDLLAASTMNLVIKVEFIESIRAKMKKLARSSKDSKTKKQIESIINDIDEELREQTVWNKFAPHFDQVHGDFLIRLRKAFPELTTQDQKLCAYLRLNLNTKEVAQLMGISVRGIEVARYRLRKRLDLQTKQNLSSFILEF